MDLTSFPFSILMVVVHDLLLVSSYDVVNHNRGGDNIIGNVYSKEVLYIPNMSPNRLFFFHTIHTYKNVEFWPTNGLSKT